MKKLTHLVISALSVMIFALLAPASFAQKGQAMSKAQAMAQQLSLTPQQKEKILPILASEVPKLQHIKKRQFAFNCAENGTSQGYSSADRSADEDDSFT